MFDFENVFESISNLNSGIGTFLFFFEIFCIGYVFVEMAMGKRYFFRKTLETYNNSYFDRVLHYLIWGIICNVVFILFVGVNRVRLEGIIDVFNSTAKVADILKDITSGNTASIQLAIFGSYYIMLISLFGVTVVRFFLYFDIIMDTAINLGINLGQTLVEIYEKYIQKKRLTFWQKIKKLFQ